MDEAKRGGRIWIWIALAIALAAGLFATGVQTGILAREEARPVDASALRAARERHLLPIQNLLHENGEISTELRRSYVEYPGGIQESYFAKIVRDGPGKHRDMKDKIDRLNRNNLDIVRHMDAYGEPQTRDLKEHGAFFREHARRYDERWRALPIAAAKGAELPVAQPMFPPGFPRAVAAELAAVDKLTAG